MSCAKVFVFSNIERRVQLGLKAEGECWNARGLDTVTLLHICFLGHRVVVCTGPFFQRVRYGSRLPQNRIALVTLSPPVAPSLLLGFCCLSSSFLSSCMGALFLSFLLFFFISFMYTCIFSLLKNSFLCFEHFQCLTHEMKARSLWT